eukprot:6178505-Pleurochrysis_carterae.AAC.1
MGFTCLEPLRFHPTFVLQCNIRSSWLTRRCTYSGRRARAGQRSPNVRAIHFLQPCTCRSPRCVTYSLRDEVAIVGALLTCNGVVSAAESVARCLLPVIALLGSAEIEVSPGIQQMERAAQNCCQSKCFVQCNAWWARLPRRRPLRHSYAKGSNRQLTDTEGLTFWPNCSTTALDKEKLPLAFISHSLSARPCRPLWH